MYLRIRKAREDAGYTREKFAELLDVSVSYLAEVERGKSTVSVKTLINICNLLGLSADYVLFGGTGIAIRQDQKNCAAWMTSIFLW